MNSINKWRNKLIPYFNRFLWQNTYNSWGALINIIQAIYSSAPSLEEARHTIEVALNNTEDLVAKVEDPECPKCNSKISKH